MARTLNVVYNPLSFEEINQPLVMQTQFHYAMLDQLDEQMEKGAVLNNLKYSDMDSPEYQNYLNYYNQVSDLAKNIGERGAMASDKNLMRGLRQTYANEIVPMEQAYLRRAEEQKMLREAQMKDPDLLVGNNPSMTGLKSYLDPNFTALNQTLSGKDITNEVSALTKQLANDIVSVSNLGALEGTNGTLIKIWKKKGFTNSDILRFANGDTSGKNAEMFNDVINTVISSKNITSWDAWNNQDFRDRVYEYANKGLYAGIGDSDISIQQDPFAVAALKKKGSETTKKPKAVPMNDITTEFENSMLKDYGVKNFEDARNVVGLGHKAGTFATNMWNKNGVMLNPEEWAKANGVKDINKGMSTYWAQSITGGGTPMVPITGVGDPMARYKQMGKLLSEINAPKWDFDEWSKYMQDEKKKAEGDKFKPWTQQELWGMYNSADSYMYGVYRAQDVDPYLREMDSEGAFATKQNTKMFEIQVGPAQRELLENRLGSRLRSNNGKNINITEVSRVKHGGVYETGKGDVAKYSDFYDDKGSLKGNITIYFSDKVGNEGIYLNIDGKTFRAGDNILSETARTIVREATADYNFYGKTMKDVEKAARGDKKALERCREFAKIIDQRQGNNQLSMLDDNSLLWYVNEIAKQGAESSYSTMYDTYTEDLFGKSAGRSYEVGSTETVKNEDED
jgi:hypothetical protein